MSGEKESPFQPYGPLLEKTELAEKECRPWLTHTINQPMPPPLDFTHTHRPAQVQENLIAYMRLFAGLADVAMRDDADTFWIASGSDAPGDNILRARWPADGVEERIDAVFAEVGAYIPEAAWMVFPGDTPADLGARLEARGMPGGPAGNWLYADLTNLGPAPEVGADFRIERVTDDERMAEWTRVSEAGFGTESGALSRFYDAYARHGYGPEAFSLHYIGYLGDKPVTSGTLLDAGGFAAVYDLSTLKDFRRQGFGGALMHWMMREMVKRGHKDTWIWSSNMAKRLYQQLGYRVATFGIREHVWKR